MISAMLTKTNPSSTTMPTTAIKQPQPSASLVPPDVAARISSFAAFFSSNGSSSQSKSSLRAVLSTYLHQSSTFRMAMNASCGTSTLPMFFMRFLPAFCFSSSLRLRLMSPP